MSIPLKHAVKKIVLITLPMEAEFGNWTTPKFFMPSDANKYMPLGIMSLASNLPDDLDVVILDPSSDGWTIQHTIDRVNEEDPDILGISAVTRRVYALNEILKKTNATYKVVGGPHVTHYAQLTLKAGADAVFIGSLADKEFAHAVEHYPKGVIQCKTDINEINFPIRTLVPVENYFPKESRLFRADNRLPLYSSVGCPHKCSYCNVQSKKLNLKSKELVVDEMQYLHSLGCRSVHVLDDNFNVSRHHLRGIIEEMEARNFKIEWSGRGQTNMDTTLTERLVATGFKRIHTGVEALDDTILTYFKKSSRMKDIINFCDSMNKNNVDVLAYMILGSPVETEEYRRKLPQMIKDFGIEIPFFNILFPEPDTPYYTELLKDGIYKKDYWGEFMENPTPYFQIPYPYGEEKKKEIVSYVNDLTRYFNPEKSKNYLDDC